MQITVGKQGRLKVSGELSKAGLEAARGDLQSADPLAHASLEILRELAKAVKKVEQCAGVVKLIGMTAADGSINVSVQLSASITRPGPEPVRDLSRVDLNGISITELNLSARARRGLHRMGIYYVAELVSKTFKQLVENEVRNFGPVSVQEIQDQLARRGLKLSSK